MAKKLPSFVYSPKDSNKENGGYANRTFSRTVNLKKLDSASSPNDNNRPSKSEDVTLQSPARAKGQEIANLYANWAAASGGIPIPWVDVAIITGLQVRLIMSLAKLYNVPFSKHRAKTALLSITSGGTTVAFGGIAKITFPGAMSIFGSASKSAIGLGTLMGAASVGALAYSSTMLLAKLFMDSFEKSTTVSQKQIHKMTEKYAEEFKEA